MSFWANRRQRPAGNDEPVASDPHERCCGWRRLQRPRGGVRCRCIKAIEFETDARSWPPSETHLILFCWEAFVSDKAHGRKHVQDAATAAMTFLSAESNLAGATTIVAERPLSLIAAAALWSGSSN